MNLSGYEKSVPKLLEKNMGENSCVIRPNFVSAVWDPRMLVGNAVNVRMNYA